jgi:hypothetical protein
MYFRCSTGIKINTTAPPEIELYLPLAVADASRVAKLRFGRQFYGSVLLASV